MRYRNKKKIFRQQVHPHRRHTIYRTAWHHIPDYNYVPLNRLSALVVGSHNRITLQSGNSTPSHTFTYLCLLLPSPSPSPSLTLYSFVRGILFLPPAATVCFLLKSRLHFLSNPPNLFKAQQNWGGGGTEDADRVQLAAYALMQSDTWERACASTASYQAT